MVQEDNDARLQKILDGKADEVKAALGDLPVPDLQRLEELEVGGKARSSVVDAIDAAIKARADDDGEGDEDNNVADPDAGSGAEADDPNTSQAEKDVGPSHDNLAAPSGRVKRPTRPKPDEPEASPKAQRGEIPKWQKPDYSGGLTIEQAEWRRTHLK